MQLQVWASSAWLVARVCAAHFFLASAARASCTHVAWSRFPDAGTDETSDTPRVLSAVLACSAVMLLLWVASKSECTPFRSSSLKIGDASPAARRAHSSARN